jgi:hypothetical protein
MEPYRPLVDYYVKEALAKNMTEVNPESKQMISGFLWADLDSSGETTPFYAATERLAFSLVNSFKLKECRIEIAGIKLPQNDPPELV